MGEPLRYGTMVVIDNAVVNVAHVELVGGIPMRGDQQRSRLYFVSGKRLDVSLSVSEVMERINWARGYELESPPLHGAE